jgi:hypothetical protein
VETTITAMDDDTVTVSESRQTGGVAVLYAYDCPLDREGAVRVIEALTAAVELKDREEAEKEAAKLKAGDKVTGRHSPSRRGTVITDEDENGRVDVVNLDSGSIMRDRPASAFRRTARADGGLIAPRYGARVSRADLAPF